MYFLLVFASVGVFAPEPPPLSADVVREGRLPAWQQSDRFTGAVNTADVCPPGFDCPSSVLSATPVRDSAARLVASLEPGTAPTPQVPPGFDSAKPPAPGKGESFFSPQNLLLGAGLAASAWWDVKTSKDCFAAPPVVVGTVMYRCVETNPKMAANFAKGDGAVWRAKAISNGVAWLGGWGFRWLGGKIGGSGKVIGNIVGYAMPLYGIGVQVKVSLDNKRVLRDLERMR